ncbi:MAG TPA: hypothetical protein VLB84_04575 [Bacteroidia bacterium]|nr:hypothetical protein [Bacteroidia bacterium]
MEYISKRISIKQKEQELSIVILSTVNKVKRTLLFCWFFLWSASGVIVFTQFFLIPDENTKVALIVWLGFWAYFEYKIFTAFMWRRFGVEKIKLKGNKLFYKRDVAGRGKIKVFEYEFIKDFRIIDKNDSSLMDSLNNSYWVVAGERIAFDYYGKEIKLGLQLDDEEAEGLFKLLNKKIKQ